MFYWLADLEFLGTEASKCLKTLELLGIPSYPRTAVYFKGFVVSFWNCSSLTANDFYWLGIGEIYIQNCCDDFSNSQLKL